MKVKNDYLEDYIKGYKEVINLNYDHIKEHHKDVFPLLKFEKYLDYCILKFNDKQFYYEHAMLIVDNHKFPIKELDFTNIDSKDFSKVVDYSQYHRIEKFVELKFPDLLNKKILIIEGFQFGVKAQLRGESRAEKDYKDWKSEQKTQLNAYNHNITSPYSHLDYDGLVANFSIDGFIEDFQYQMEQAEECYKRKLYLPAAATLSVALETVLLGICKKENIKLDNDTMLNYLGDQLLHRKIINYRLAKRIDITYSLRNSLAHSNKGEVAKADCEIILNTIRTVIDDYFTK